MHHFTLFCIASVLLHLLLQVDNIIEQHRLGGKSPRDRSRRTPSRARKEPSDEEDGNGEEEDELNDDHEGESMSLC